MRAIGHYDQVEWTVTFTLVVQQATAIIGELLDTDTDGDRMCLGISSRNTVNRLPRVMPTPKQSGAWSA